MPALAGAARGDLPGQFLRAYSVAVIGAWILLVPGHLDGGCGRPCWPSRWPGAVTFGWMSALGIHWGDVQSATARWLSSTFWLEQARLAEQFWGEARPQLSAPLFELAGQARMIVRDDAGGAGAGDAGWPGTRLARPFRAGGAAPRSRHRSQLAAFTFSDHAVWLVVISLALLLIPGGTRCPACEQVAVNVLLVMLVLYALRGAAVFRAGTGRVSPLGIALYTRAHDPHVCLRGERPDRARARRHLARLPAPHGADHRRNQVMMEVILREDVQSLGKAGQLVRVKPGYARNFLLPRGLAFEATEGNKKRIDAEARARATKASAEKAAVRAAGRPACQHHA